MYQWKSNNILPGIVVFALFTPVLFNKTFSLQISDIVIPDWIYYIVVPLIIAIAGFCLSHRKQQAAEKQFNIKQEAAEKQLKNAETLRKVEFYQTLIKKLSRMLKNPGFTSIDAPEDTYDIRMTFREIDDLPLDMYLTSEVSDLYDKFRAPWDKMYASNNVKTRQELVDMIVEFRNIVVGNYNSIIDENKLTFHKFAEFDKDSFQVEEDDPYDSD